MVLVGDTSAGLEVSALMLPNLRKKYSVEERRGQVVDRTRVSSGFRAWNREQLNVSTDDIDAELSGHRVIATENNVLRNQQPYRASQIRSSALQLAGLCGWMIYFFTSSEKLRYIASALYYYSAPTVGSV